MLDLKMDTDWSLKVIIILLFFIIGYLGIMTGILTITLKWVFYNFNTKLEHLNSLLKNSKENVFEEKELKEKELKEPETDKL